MSKQSPQPPPRNKRFFGEDFWAAMRLGLAEIRETTIAFPGQTPIAQQPQYGAIGNPPPSLVADHVKEHDQEKGFSIEQLKERGREILRGRENDRQQDRGLDLGG